MVNYSSCYATSRVCRVKRNSLGKWRKKPLQRNFRAPHYTLPLGTFTPFISHLMNCLLFSAFQAPHKFALVLVSICTVQKAWKRVGGHWSVPISLNLFDFNHCELLFLDGELLHKWLVITHCMKLGKVVAFKMFLKIYYVLSCLWRSLNILLI